MLIFSLCFLGAWAPSIYFAKTRPSLPNNLFPVNPHHRDYEIPPSSSPCLRNCEIPPSPSLHLRNCEIAPPDTSGKRRSSEILSLSKGKSSIHKCLCSHVYTCARANMRTHAHVNDVVGNRSKILLVLPVLRHAEHRLFDRRTRGSDSADVQESMLCSTPECLLAVEKQIWNT